MNQYHYIKSLACASAVFFSGLGSAAATTTLYGTLVDFQAGLSGAPAVTQDFSSFADGASLLGVNVLPGVTMSTNLNALNVFNSAGLGKVAFATTRNQPESNYDINVNGAYKAFGFEINGYDPNTTGPGFLSYFFANGDTTYTEIPVLPPATESTALFFGVISDSAIVKIRWSEGPEIGFSCCEETVIDNLIAAQPVPEPAESLMLVVGLGAVSWFARRRVADVQTAKHSAQ
jgi:hypothetical protein